jgi:hypothetical protein
MVSNPENTITFFHGAAFQWRAHENLEQWLKNLGADQSEHRLAVEKLVYPSWHMPTYQADGNNGIVCRNHDS